SGLTYSKFLKSAGYFGSPKAAIACTHRPEACGAGGVEGPSSDGVTVTATAAAPNQALSSSAAPKRSGLRWRTMLKIVSRRGSMRTIIRGIVGSARCARRKWCNLASLRPNLKCAGQIHADHSWGERRNRKRVVARPGGVAGADPPGEPQPATGEPR